MLISVNFVPNEPERGAGATVRVRFKARYTARKILSIDTRHPLSIELLRACANIAKNAHFPTVFIEGIPMCRIVVTSKFYPKLCARLTTLLVASPTASPTYW